MKKLIVFAVAVSVLLPLFARASSPADLSCTVDDEVRTLQAERVFIVQKLRNDVEEINSFSSVYPYSSGLNVMSLESQEFEDSAKSITDGLDRLRFIVQQLNQKSGLRLQ